VALALVLAPLGCDCGGGVDDDAGGGEPDAGIAVDGGSDAALADVSGVDHALSDSGSPDVQGDASGLDAGAAPDADCLLHTDCLGYRRCEQFSCVDPGPSPLQGSVLLNEILIDGTVDEDANDDGDIDGTEDEFVELVNVSATSVDLSGFLVVETDHLAVPRHTFPPGSSLPAGEALVLFGGGAPSAALEATANASFAVVNAADPAFSNGLNLDDSGDVLRLLDAEYQEVFNFAYGDACSGVGCWPATSDRSLTRAPDLTGDYEAHDQAAGAGGAIFSPGTQLDGTPFGP